MFYLTSEKLSTSSLGCENDNCLNTKYNVKTFNNKKKVPGFGCILLKKAISSSLDPLTIT